MAAHTINATATKLLAAGVTEAEIEAHGGRYINGEGWMAFGRSDEAAFHAYADRALQITFTKINGEWGVKGLGLEAGKEITITKRDGSIKTAWVVAMVTETTATVTFDAPAPVTETAEPTEKTAAQPVQGKRGWSRQSRYGYSPRTTTGHYGTTCTICGAREVSPGVCDNC